MNIDSNAWIQPREKCNQTLSKPEDQRKGGKKRQPKSWWARPSSPGFSAWYKVIRPPWVPVPLSEEVDKSQRPQGHHTDHIPNRGTRKTDTCSIFTGLYTRYRREGAEVHALHRCPPQWTLLEHISLPSPEKQPAPPHTPSPHQPHLCA